MQFTFIIQIDVEHKSAKKIGTLVLKIEKKHFDFLFYHSAIIFAFSVCGGGVCREFFSPVVSVCEEEL